MILPGFSALPGFKAPFHGDGESALNPGTTVHSNRLKHMCDLRGIPGNVFLIPFSKEFKGQWLLS